MHTPKKISHKTTRSRVRAAISAANSTRAAIGPHELVAIPQKLADRLSKAVLVERGKGIIPDKSMIAEQALKSWLDANGH